jgi:hypothetical protein
MCPALAVCGHSGLRYSIEGAPQSPHHGKTNLPLPQAVRVATVVNFSESRMMAGLQCPKRLYLRLYNPSLGG